MKIKCETLHVPILIVLLICRSSIFFSAMYYFKELSFVLLLIKLIVSNVTGLFREGCAQDVSQKAVLL